MHQPSDKEVEREFRRIFSRLAEHGAVLKPECKFGGDKGWGVYVRRNNYRKPVMKVENAIVTALPKCDWLTRKGEKVLELSDSGRAWFRRASADRAPFLSQHQARRTQRQHKRAQSGEIREVNLAESPLSWLRSRKDSNGRSLLSIVQFEAGERLRSDFERAQLRPAVTSNWQSTISPTKRRRGGERGPASEISELVMASKQNVSAALEAVGPELSSILLEVCCFLNGLERAETNLNWPRRSGKLVLQIALNRLAEHYGMASARGPQRPTEYLHWGSDGYRPQFS